MNIDIGFDEFFQNDLKDMITKADDYPIHQLPHPVSEVGTEKNFYDRYFFNGYSKKEDFYFAAVLCLYPNLNIMDASFTLAFDGIQHNVRSSRIFGLERLDTQVGPIDESNRASRKAFSRTFRK